MIGIVGILLAVVAQELASLNLSEAAPAGLLTWRLRSSILLTGIVAQEPESFDLEKLNSGYGCLGDVVVDRASRWLKS